MAQTRNMTNWFTSAANDTKTYASQARAEKAIEKAIGELPPVRGPHGESGIVFVIIPVGDRYMPVVVAGANKTQHGIWLAQQGFKFMGV